MSTHLSSQKIAQGLMYHRNILMAGMILATLALILPASQVRVDPSGVTFETVDSEGCKDYLAFIESFGTDDYILLAVKNDLNVSDPIFKNRITIVNTDLARLESVLKVIDLGTIASSDVLKIMGTLHFWDQKTLTALSPVIPGLSRLISNDMKTIAFIIKIDTEKLNGFQLEKQLGRMKQILVAAFPEHPLCYAAGMPVLRAAFERYNLMNAVVFGSIGLVFGTLVAFYIFKTIWAGTIVVFTSLTALIWTLGIMGMFDIPLNLATGLSFGFILIASTTTIFHIVSKYIQLLKCASHDMALAKTLEIVLRPCFMCALTTSAGFFSLTISPVKMAQQAGMIISIGVILAFFVTLVITSFCLPRCFISKACPGVRIQKDFLDQIVNQYAVIGLIKPGVCVLAGVVFFILLATGIPRIKTVKHLTTPIIKTTPEAEDLRFIEQHISTATSFSIVLTVLENGFDSRKFWYDLYRFEQKIKSIPGVQGIESLTPLIFRMALKLSPMGVRPESVFHQVISQSSKNDMIRSYVDPVSKRLRIIVHIENQTSDQTEAILKQVETDAREAFAEQARVTLSGQLILLRSQTTNLVSSQIKTLFLALFIITVLMVFQLKSIALGLLSLIPNLFPLVTIFGIMGWFQIHLDPLTIFAAVISFGLSVDDSIHYLTQLRREMLISKSKSSIQNSLKAAYDVTSRSLVSTTAVLFLSSLGLVFSSFSHVFYLGVLIAAASIVALLADLIFMPALVMAVMPINRLLSNRCAN